MGIIRIILNFSRPLVLLKWLPFNLFNLIVPMYQCSDQSLPSFMDCLKGWIQKSPLLLTIIIVLRSLSLAVFALN